MNEELLSDHGLLKCLKIYSARKERLHAAALWSGASGSVSDEVN